MTYDLLTPEGIEAYYREGIEPRTKVEKKAYRRDPRAWRILKTRADPLLFALVYLRHHLKDDATGGRITFGEAHLEWVERAREWLEPVTAPEESRHAEIAPRSMGKSTWWFLLLPMWAAAHGHLKFIAAFADTRGQAELHLATFKRELERNELLGIDFPDLVNPLTRGRGVLASDNRGLYLARSGFAFMAKGIDSASLGAKIGNQRPDMLLLDDVEPSEDSYSAESMKGRLTTITDAVLPLSIMARVVIVGTVTMAGSIVHQLVKAANGEEPEAWISQEKIVAHHHHPILVDDDGVERSCWPAKWSMTYLERIRHTRSFAKNFENDPLGADGDYWTKEDFITGALEAVTHRLLSVDPAVTSKASSDFTGLAVVGYEAMTKRCEITMAVAVKMAPAFLRQRILKELEKDPSIGLILIETNQGGDVWKAILHHMPVPVATVHQSIKKEVRAAEILNDYQTKRIIHHPSTGQTLLALEQQMTSFPSAPNDDLVDAAGSGIAYFLHRKKKPRASAENVAYV